MENFWQTCSAQLEQELTPQQYSAWIKPLAPLDYEDGTLRIAAPNRFKLDWVKTQFASRITTLAAQFWEMPVDVQFVLDPRLSAAKKPTASATIAPSQSDDVPASVLEPIPSNAGEATPRRDQSRINTALTFESFVTGKACLLYTSPSPRD